MGAVTRVQVRRQVYADSVALMQVTTAISDLPGVESAAVAMATELNREVLAAAGLLVGEAATAGPNDLVIAVRAASEAQADAALARAEALLAERRRAATGVAQEPLPRSVRSAARRLGEGANLALISVPGLYAAGEAWQALLQGLHVFLFSDNVPLADEVALKRHAREHDLLVMGPDCGTAIINGVGLGFANVVRRGRIGLVGASGSGMQEVAVLLHRLGEGISQAIGTGGRDLYEQVGGITTLQGLALLRDDPQTEAIVIVSKPPAPAVAEWVLGAAAETGKPVIACLLGLTAEPPRGVQAARSLDEAARLAVAARGGRVAVGEEESDTPWPRLRPDQCEVRGLYCGGTLRDEARLALGDVSQRLIDFGDDQYTQGRAHPMIDPTLRNQALLAAADDPRVAVVLLDVILGYGAHPDPAADLAPLLRQARERAAAAGRELPVFVHVAGTDLDPQGLERQEEALRAAGATLFASNHRAAVAARRLVEARAGT